MVKASVIETDKILLSTRVMPIFALRNRAGSHKHSSMVEHQPYKLKDRVQIPR